MLIPEFMADLRLLHWKNQIQLNQLISEVRDQYSAHPILCYFTVKMKYLVSI